MKILALAAVLGAALVGLRAAPAAAQPTTNLRRFALIASSNDGGPSRSRLRYAESDAVSMARVLEGLGGVHARDLVVVRDASRGALQVSFDRMKRLVAESRAAGVRHELFVYYSGHSDEQGLLLGREMVGYPELRRWIDETGADVKIAVLDSCASGSLIRMKGGTRRPPFLTDAATRARGHAFLTASSADEAAQESDRIGAAYFTHYLLSGLRGAADANRDRRVTLNEAYQFAYDETLRRTESSRAGAQHAAYDIQLAGIGDLVMTDLRTSSARMVLSHRLSGRLYVRDASGRLVVELRKEPLYPVEIGLEPGSYRVVLDADGRPFEARVELREGARAELAQETFMPLAPTVAMTRGGADVHVTGAGKVYRDVPFDLVLVPGVRTSGFSKEPIRNSVAVGLITESDVLHGVQLGLAANIVKDELRGAQWTSGVNLSYGPGRGVQLAAGANVALADFTGVQSAPFNVATRNFLGGQTGVVNYLGGDMRGAQTGVANYLGGSARGAQVGVANYVGGDMRGAQISVLNIGGHVRGAQVGVINVAAKVDGAQVGVVNFAKSSSGVSFGVLPIVLDGYNRLALWSSDLSAANVGVKLGARHFYTLFGAGAATKEGRGRDDDGERTWSTSFGLGGHFAREGGRFFVDLDAVGTSYWMGSGFGNDERVLSSLRLVGGYQIARHLAVTAGPTFNVDVAWNGRDHRPGLGIGERIIRDGGTTVRLFPGFVLGMQI